MSELRSGRLRIWLDRIREGDGPTLLLLHELGASSEAWKGDAAAGLDAWPGSVHALDFSGHGRSGRVTGGVYYPELLAGDVDRALAEIGPSWLVGAGLGAYVALLVAGGRRDLVPGALLLPGAGLDGGGPVPNPERSPVERLPDPGPSAGPDLQAEPSTDPHALRWLAGDPRPVDYAVEFARAARGLRLAEDGSSRPAWWCEARTAAGVEPFDLAASRPAIASLARQAIAGDDVGSPS